MNCLNKFANSLKKRLNIYKLYNPNYKPLSNPKVEDTVKAQDFEKINNKYNKYNVINNKFTSKRWGYGHYITYICDFFYLGKEYCLYWYSKNTIGTKIWNIFNTNIWIFTFYHIGFLFYFFNIGSVFYLLGELWEWLKFYFLENFLRFYKDINHIYTYNKYGFISDYDFSKYIQNEYIYLFWIEIMLILFFIIILLLLISDYYSMKNPQGLDENDNFLKTNLGNTLTLSVKYKAIRAYYSFIILIIIIIVMLNYFYFYKTNYLMLREVWSFPIKIIHNTGDFYFSFLSLFVKMLTLIAFGWWLWTARAFVQNEKSFYYSLFLIPLTYISVLASLIMISSCNLIIIYLLMEIQSLCFYVLAAWNDKFEIKGAESGLKYLFLGGFSSNLFLFGVALIYATLNTVNLFDIITIVSVGNSVLKPLFYIGFSFITFGILFKLAIVPFHFWISDVYEGSHWLLVSFFSVVPKLPYVYLLLEFWCNLFSPFQYILYLKELWIFMSILSIFYGCVFMLYTSHLARIAAYSSMINMGFIAFSIACSLEVKYIIFYLLAYLLQLFLFFALIVSFKINYIHDLQDLLSKNSYLAFVLMIVLFSLMGIPPFAGFCSKFLLIKSFVFNEEIFLSFIFVFLSVLSALPYLRIVRMIYSFIGKRTMSNNNYNNKFTYNNMLIINILLLLNIYFICYSNIILVYFSKICFV